MLKTRCSLKGVEEIVEPSSGCWSIVFLHGGGPLMTSYDSWIHLTCSNFGYPYLLYAEHAWESMKICFSNGKLIMGCWIASGMLVWKLASKGLVCGIWSVHSSVEFSLHWTFDLGIPNRFAPEKSNLLHLDSSSTKLHSMCLGGHRWRGRSHKFCKGHVQEHTLPGPSAKNKM